MHSFLSNVEPWFGAIVHVLLQGQRIPGAEDQARGGQHAASQPIQGG